MAIAADAIPGQMHFLARDPKYLTEKPYTLRYAPGPDDDFPQTNIERVLHPLVFHDLRGCPDLKYETCGFMVTESPSAMAYDDYADTDKIEDVHVPEVVAAVKAALGAKSVEMLDYVLRKRVASFPISTGQPYEYNQPASRAHIDHTYGGGRDIIRERYKEKAELVLEGRWQLINVWHPLRGPLTDWPLALCDARTVDFGNDTMPGDVVDPNHVFENTQVHYNSAQKWYYLSNQLPTELMLFKNADSEEPVGATPGVPHASFDNPLRKESDFRRESIEIRILAVW